MNSVAIIPARGGSKRIPRKNIREFCGKPMIAWSIQAALESGCFERIIVSTDDHEVAAIAEEYGAEVPFQRPAELADDHTPTIPVIIHALDALDLGQDQPVCCLYATAPLVKSSDITSSKKILLEQPQCFVVPVTTYAYPIQRALRRDPAGRLEMFDPSMTSVRSQDLDEAWHDVGQFYWALAQTWRSHETVFGRSSIGFQIPRYRVQDIDTMEDWRLAEKLATRAALEPS